MSSWEMVITIGAVVLGTMATRFTPFLIFSKTTKPPALITYLGTVLPAAVMGLLVVYSLKDVTVWDYPHGLPEVLAIVALVVIHLIKHNMLLSIATGTIVYMVLIQQVFVK
ncbi:branched-chain amino acid transporter permease [Veillonella criceti]|uniref:Predicted membrane protein n=1 Tax=Veillonella criceti TaxID=103891 RepID=A0A380NM54_9FIRM|nr:AzlD domain-containing protein [Veillonella criceti]SUP43125.1 Predicted membrane protein [Veillonella criceti]